MQNSLHLHLMQIWPQWGSFLSIFDLPRITIISFRIKTNVELKYWRYGTFTVSFILLIMTFCWTNSSLVAHDFALYKYCRRWQSSSLPRMPVFFDAKHMTSTDWYRFNVANISGWFQELSTDYQRKKGKIGNRNNIGHTTDTNGNSNETEKEDSTIHRATAYLDDNPNVHFAISTTPFAAPKMAWYLSLSYRSSEHWNSCILARGTKLSLTIW